MEVKVKKSIVNTLGKSIVNDSVNISTVMYIYENVSWAVLGSKNNWS